MPEAPHPKRAIVFIDGQNLFRSAKRAFGVIYPNYDANKLAKNICTNQGWQLTEVRFYTGIPSKKHNSHWHKFWNAKLLHMSRQSTYVFSRPLRYRKRFIELPDGVQHEVIVGEEKGVDVRIAVDAISLGHKNAYDVALIISQDQDLSEVSDEIRVIAREQNRWIKVASAFPDSTLMVNRRGINGTDWITISKEVYDSCKDEKNYRI